MGAIRTTYQNGDKSSKLGIPPKKNPLFVTTILSLIGYISAIPAGEVVFDAQISRLALLRRGWIKELHQTVEEELTSTCPQLRKGNRSGRSRAASLVDVKEELTKAYPKEIGDLELNKCMADYDLQPEEILDNLPYSTLIRVAIAKLMLWKPDVLLLDDVTEDLEKATSDVDDISKACSWLENFLLCAESLKIVLMASHDRSFMDKVCHGVIEICQENHVTTRVLEGNYGRAYLAGGDFLHFHSFSLWQPKSAGLRATQAACAFASLVVNDFFLDQDVTGIPFTWKMVDVGTGTGILSLILAQQFHRHFEANEHFEMEIWAIDLDKAALDVASVNFDRSPWREKIFTYHGDFRTWKPQWKDPPKTFICNPPYNDDATVHRKSGSVEDLSRRRALERSFLPLEELCLEVAKQGCESLWILWGNMEVP